MIVLVEAINTSRQHAFQSMRFAWIESGVAAIPVEDGE